MMPIKSTSFEFSQFFKVDRLIGDALNGMFDSLHEFVDFLVNGESINIKHFNSNFSLTVSDAEGKVIWNNQNFSALTGYNQHEILGKRVRDAMYGKKSIRIDKNYVDDHIKNGVPFYFENIGYKKSGTEYWFGVVVFPIHNTKNELFGRLHCILDITEKKLMMLSAMKNETVINLAIENIDTIFWSFEVSEQQLVLSDKQKGILAPEFALNIENTVAGIINSRSFSVEAPKATISNVEIETNEPEAPKKIFDLTIKCIEWDSNFKPVQYVGALHDVTIMNHQYSELLEKNKELEKLNSNLDSFVYSASHNLRSPLTSIKGIVDILLAQQLPPDDQLFFIKEINRSIAKLDSTIFDIIEYSKNTRSELEMAEMDLEQIINRSFTDNRYYNYLAIDFKLSLDIACPFYTDIRRVTSVIDNIITNAIKYSDSGKSQSYINIHVQVSEQACVIRVEDNGIGMSDDTLQKAFKMFYRGTNKASGSGLGLFIVKETLDKIGGTIGMTSQLGMGTTIIITVKNIK
jgi:PAS domain S-box-containing protein